ncbi:MAG TPA: cellulase family glycosylhydrolase, partial [Longimicrobiales bacterium]|nr:cellulase family glycosylhydrolase [Longimicrobiales bacterium]
MRRSKTIGRLLVGSVLLAGCMDASGPQPSAPDKLERITAEQLTGSPGFAVTPIQVRVVDTHGAGVRGQAVTFTVVSGGGTISPASTSTDSTGIATATWTLGPVAGSNVARADAGKLGSVTFTASATESPGVIITALSGSSTTTIPGGCALPDPVMVKVTDATGKPVPNAVVEFDPDKSGSANPAVANTDAQGIAKTVWTAGLDGGANTLRAVLRNSARPSVTFTATSTPRAPNGFAVVGNKILDSQCKPIVFHGIARPSLQWNAGGDDRFNTNAADDFALIKSWKANVVRVAVTQVFWLPGNKQYDPTYKQRVIDTVNKARALGLAVILDLHASDRGNPNYSTVPDVQQLPDAAHSIPFWKDAAATFKNDGGVIFELYNEPHDITWDQWRNGGFIAAGPSYVGDPFTREAYQGVGMQQVLDAVRSVGANNLVIVSGLHWGYILDELSKYALTGSNIVY